MMAGARAAEHPYVEGMGVANTGGLVNEIKLNVIQNYLAKRGTTTMFVVCLKKTESLMEVEGRLVLLS
jgi:hypothetical protein